MQLTSFTFGTGEKLSKIVDTLNTSLSLSLCSNSNLFHSHQGEFGYAMDYLAKCARMVALILQERATIACSFFLWIAHL